MREIKFRGRVKNTNNPQWVYGIVIPPQYSSWEDWTLFDGERRWIVDPETVGQYTGYKDVDGKEIYEGDILANFEPPVGQRIIRFGEFENWKCCVIGNIHDNPELLNSDEKHV